jgi:hypothetical protein
MERPTTNGDGFVKCPISAYRAIAQNAQGQGVQAWRSEAYISSQGRDDIAPQCEARDGCATRSRLRRTSHAAQRHAIFHFGNPRAVAPEGQGQGAQAGRREAYIGTPQQRAAPCNAEIGLLAQSLRVFVFGRADSGRRHEHLPDRHRPLLEHHCKAGA